MATPDAPLIAGPPQVAPHSLTGTKLAANRLWWFVQLRGAFALTAIVAAALEMAMGAGQRPVGFWVTIGILLLINGAWAGLIAVLQRMKQDGRLRRCPGVPLAHAQMAVDLLLLTVLLHFAGGVRSPLAAFYVFHMVIGGVLLPPGQAAAQGAWALLLYGGLTYAELGDWLQPAPKFWTTQTPATLSTAADAVAHVSTVACLILVTLYLAVHIAAERVRHALKLEDAYAALRAADARLLELHRRRARFMQTAAHQLKSPLAAIQTLAALIHDEIVTGAAIGQTARRIVRRCREGIASVAELLTLARLQDADPGSARAGNADAVAVIAEECRRCEPLAAEKEVTVAWQAPESPRLVAAVAPQDLRDCTANLLDNAIKYSGRGGRVEVELAAAQDALGRSAIRLVVRDHGVGIDPDTLGRGDLHSPLFEPFRRGANVQAEGISGSGLGLAIVREVLERCGGDVHVRSQIGAGAEFTLRFPAATSGEPASEARVPPLWHSGAPPGAAPHDLRTTPAPSKSGTNGRTPSNSTGAKSCSIGSSRTPTC